MPSGDKTPKPFHQSEAMQDAQAVADTFGVTLDPKAEAWNDWRAAFRSAESWQAFNLAWDARMRARCGISDDRADQKHTARQIATPPAQRGQARREILDVLPSDPGMAISCKDVLRRLKMADTRENVKLMGRKLDAMAEMGTVDRTVEGAQSTRGAVRGEGRQRWYRLVA